MTMAISRRTLVRILSFAVAAAAVLSGLAWSARRDAQNSRQTLERYYLQSVANLTTYVQSIDSGLEKAMYAGTPAMLSQLSSKLWREAGFAKEALDALPIGYDNVRNTNKLLSQIGDYCVSLARGFSRGESVSEEQRQNLLSLRKYCDSMLQEVYALYDEVQTGSLQLVAQANGGNPMTDAEPADVAEGFLEFEEGFTAYPTLIYDGPFSDHISQREPERLKGEANVSRAVARQKAALLLSIPQEQLADASDEEGNMPSYGFTVSSTESAGIDLSLTKQGGLLSYMLKSRDIGERAVSAEDAFTSAKQFLKKLDLPNMRATYYEIQRGVMTINFAAVQKNSEDNSVLLYPDLVKVGVALDNAEVVSYDARGLLTNHTERAKLLPGLTAEQARQSVSSHLSIKKELLCLIPSVGLNEVLCWEFKTMTEDGQTVLVYVNAATGAEENILLLISSENGQLTI